MIQNQDKAWKTKRITGIPGYTKEYQGGKTMCIRIFLGTPGHVRKYSGILRNNFFFSFC